jgi:hypothetical protein
MQISRDEAIEACADVRAKNRRRYLSPVHWQCWGCMKYGGEPERRCMRTPDGWDACTWVNCRIATRRTGA